MEPVEASIKPSWLRWPPNCCETCVNWSQDIQDKWIGTCNGALLGFAEKTDARYRCPSFQRKPEPCQPSPTTNQPN